MMTVALVGAVARAIAGTGWPTGHFALNKFVVQAAVTAMALIWWQLVFYGFAARSAVRERPL